MFKTKKKKNQKSFQKHLQPQMSGGVWLTQRCSLRSLTTSVGSALFVTERGIWNLGFNRIRGPSMKFMDSKRTREAHVLFPKQ